MADTYAYLGSGLIAPFRRDGKDDFANASGKELVNKTVGLILATRRAGPKNVGEVPFNQELGTLLPTLRHRNINDPTTEELARHYTVDSITENEPRIRVKGVGYIPRPDKNRLSVRLRYDLVERGTSGINVVARDIEEEYDL